jgi:hypothetical protein
MTAPPTYPQQNTILAILFREPVSFDAEPCGPCSRFHCEGMEHASWGCVMENTEKFRQYAEDCRRLAERAAPKDRAVLIEISNAWAACAAEAERKKQNGRATDFRDDPPPLAR